MISKWWQKEWSWHAPILKGAVLKDNQRDFEIEFFEGIVKRQADYWEVLAVLGNHYTAAKRYKEGLAVDERLAALRPNDSVVFYNLACSYSLLGSIELALESLERALALGYRDFQHVMRDRDLEAVRKDRRFRGLVSRYVKV